MKKRGRAKVEITETLAIELLTLLVNQNNEVNIASDECREFKRKLEVLKMRDNDNRKNK